LNGVWNLAIADGTFFEGAARRFGFRAVAVLVKVRAAHLASHRVRNFLFHDFGNLLGYGVGNFFNDIFVNSRRARNHFVDRISMPNLAGADLVGFAANRADPLHRVLRLAGARIDAAFANFGPNRMATAGFAIGLLAAFLHFLGNALAGCNLFANLFAHVLVAGFANVTADVAADFFRVALLDALARLRADVFIVRLAHGTADRFADFFAMLLAHLVLNLVAGDMAVLLIDRFANNFANFLLAAFGDFFTNLVFAGFHVGFDHLLVAGVGDFLDDAALNRTAAFLHDVLKALFLHLAVRCFALVFVASLGNLLVDGFLDGFVRGVPPFFGYGVIHQLVDDFVLLLTRREAALRVAARFFHSRVTAGAAIRR